MNEKISTQLPKHTMLQSVALHLLPGAFIVAAYVLLVYPVVNAGYPTIMAMIIAAIIVLIPLELGIIVVVKKKHGFTTYKEIIQNRNSISTKEYILWIVAVILLSGVVFAAGEPLANLIRDNVFSWFPESHHVDFGYSNEFSVRTLMITYTLGFLVLTVVAPIVEEIYFRGYLLPRIPEMKGYNGLFHSFLFALYHMWTPWMFITRTIGFYPFVYAVQKKHNIYIAMIAHVLVNSIDFVVGFVFVSSLL